MIECIKSGLIILVVGWAGLLATPTTQAGVAVDAPLDPAAARANWRWIGIRSDDAASCPVADGWSRGGLFDFDGQNESPPGLRPYCLYEFPFDQQVTPDKLAPLRELVLSGQLEDIGRDALAVAPFADPVSAARAAAPAPYGSELSDLTWKHLERQFLEISGRPEFLQQTDDLRAKLSIIDTAATNGNDPEKYQGNSPHGFSLVNMARALLCELPGRDDCIADVVTRLALRYVCFEPQINRSACVDEANGGYVGLIGDLATAIRAETFEWQGSEDRLVLNLSVAWDRRFGGFAQDPEDMPVPVRAVYAALQDAACRGALAIAAAGNQTFGPEQESGPMLPAAWEQIRAPSFELCTKLLGDNPNPAHFPPPGTRDQRALIYAADGLRSSNKPLYSSRDGGAPRVAAFADHAVVEWLDTGTPTATVTGSSVSSLVFASAATAVRYYQPALDPGAVVQTVYGAGKPVEQMADFCLGGNADLGCPGSGQKVHRVAVCSAASNACAAGGPFCPPLEALACPPINPLDLSGVDFSNFENPSIAQQVDLRALGEEWRPGPPCDASKLLFDSTDPPQNPCPQDQFYGQWAEPWVGPQPGSYPCPNCSTRTSSGGALYLQIDNGFTGQVEDVTLACGSTTYSLPLGTLVAGDRAAIWNLSCAGQSPVSLHFELGGGQSAESPVLNPE